MRPSSLISLGIVIVGIGCGGAVETGLFNGEGASPSEDAGQSSTDSGHPGTTRDGGTSFSDGGTNGGDGGANKDSGTTGFDAGPGPDLTVPCGDNMGTAITCNVGSQYCCATNVGNGNDPGYSCQSSGVSSCAGLRLPCNDTTDCHGAICCGAFDNITGYTGVSCKATCTASTPSGTAVHFCDPNAAVDECAASGQSCQPSQALPGYSLCK